MTTEAIKALVAAQSEMTAAHKGKINPAFRTKYAELSDVMDACLPALRNNGFAVVQPIGRDERGDFVETHILHESGHAFSSRAYLIIGKNDMQGFGSAITYARRYSLAALAGITDTDDDGNAAAKNPPARSRVITRDERPAEPPHDPQTGEVLPPRDPAQRPAQAAADDGEDAPPSVQAFVHQVMEGMSRHDLEDKGKLAHAYAMAAIAKISGYANSARAQKWLDIFCELHSGAIGRLPDDLRQQVRAAIALKQAQIRGEKADPADFGNPNGDPVILGEVRIV